MKFKSTHFVLRGPYPRFGSLAVTGSLPNTLRCSEHALKRGSLLTTSPQPSPKESGSLSAAIHSTEFLQTFYRLAPEFKLNFQYLPCLKSICNQLIILHISWKFKLYFLVSRH